MRQKHIKKNENNRKRKPDRRKGNLHEIENYSWGIIQDMIEKEINSAFKLKDNDGS